jgi:uncharacterized damage-inducible protein DinB
MPVSKEALLTHVDYTAWASKRLLDAAAKLSAEQLTRDFGTADKSVLGTLVHVFAADRIWMGRIVGRPPAKFIDPEKDMFLKVLEREWPPLLLEWSAWVGSLDEKAIAAPIAYRHQSGTAYETEAWKIILHVVNHGTHHRGQVSGFLRAMGLTPQPLDLIAYYREMDKIASQSASASTTQK